MQSGWRVGRIFGIPLLVDSSWFVIVVLFTLSYSVGLQQQGINLLLAWLIGLGTALALFGSVLLHELGHSLVARSQGITVNSITLFLFGGIASIDQESKTPGQAFQVAIAGPAVSFLLFLLLTFAIRYIPSNFPLHGVVAEIALINGILALFNMIPGLPLDGGQVLKALVWKVTGSRLKGLRWAARAGQFLGWGLLVFALSLFLQSRGSDVGLIWIGLIGWFVVSNATTYTRVADLQEAVRSLKALDVMTREFRVVDANLTLQQFMDNYLLREEGLQPAFYAASDGRYRGFVDPNDLNTIERSLWHSKRLLDIVHPLTEIPTVTESTPLTEIIDKLETLQLRHMTVLSPAVAVAGVIDRGDVVRSIAGKLRSPVPDALIQRIKEEGAYPPGLPLQAIAKAASEP
ncbi:MAG TPA: site-2 protease family protein [Synechococcales cyanobacterium M55_K2018_004]|nr:site-2 protease family protein [Synechococcales cyanobacterium M55_K2018_004]